MSDNPVISWMKNPLGIGTLLLVMFGGAVVFALNAVHGMPIVERKEVKATEVAESVVARIEEDGYAVVKTTISAPK